MYKKFLLWASIVLTVMGVIQCLTYFTGNNLAFIQAAISFTLSYAMNVQYQVLELREKIAKLSL